MFYVVSFWLHLLDSFSSHLDLSFSGFDLVVRGKSLDVMYTLTIYRLDIQSIFLKNQMSTPLISQFLNMS